jgi:hypothetical protein
MGVIFLRSDLMTVTADARGAIAEVLDLDRNEVGVLRADGEGDVQIVLTEHQARRLATLARAGKSWCEEQLLDERGGGRPSPMA